MAAHENMLSTLDLFAFTSAAVAAAALFSPSNGLSAGESISISSSSSSAPSVVVVVVPVVERLGPTDLLRRCRNERKRFWRGLGLSFVAVADVVGVFNSSYWAEEFVDVLVMDVVLFIERRENLLGDRGLELELEFVSSGLCCCWGL
jgi:hypothetical protein